MADCKKCEYAVYDALWGEYKCKALTIRLYSLSGREHCKYYKEKKADKK